MADWYLDPHNGSNSYSGDSWTVDRSGTDGVTYGTTRFTSATGNFTQAHVGRYIRIVTALRKIVAVVSSTEVTLDATYPSGSGRSWWIGGPVLNGSGLSTTTYFAAGDRVKLPGTPDGNPVSAGSLTWTHKSASVTFGSGRVKRVDECESGWVGAANVTVSHTTGAGNVVQGTNLVQAAIASAFTTGKVMYKQIGGGSPVDFSAFQGLSVMLRNGGSSAIAGWGWRLCLCSDTTGDTIVDDLALDWPASLYNAKALPMTAYKAGGGNLGSNIQSVALYVTNDPGTPTIQLDDIVAVKAVSNSDHLCHRCLISQGQSDFDHTWWGIRCFANETTITLPAAFYGASGTVNPSYRRHCTAVTMITIPTITVGTYDNPVTFSGGWDTSTDTQTGTTCLMLWPVAAGDDSVFNLAAAMKGVKFSNFFFGLTSSGRPFGPPSAEMRHMTFEDIVVAGMLLAAGNMAAFYVVAGTTSGATYDNYIFKRLRVTGIAYYAFYNIPSVANSQTMPGQYLDDVQCYSTRGIYIGCCHRLRGRNIGVYNTNTGAGLTAVEANYDWEIDGLTIKDSATVAISVLHSLSNGRFYNLVTADNASGSISVMHSDLRLFNASLSESTKYTNVKPGARVASIKAGGVADTHAIVTNEGTIGSESSIRHTASDIAWRLSPTNTDGIPLVLKVAELAVNAGAYTVSIWMRRTNTGLAGRFYTPGGSVGGVDSEISAAMTASANTWEEVSLDIEPTESGVLEFFVEAKGGTTYSLYVDDFAVA